MSERFLTLHPDPGKQGTNIDRDKYDLIRQAILESVRERGEITFQELTRAVRARVQDRFEGSVTWYVTTVKLDLEARGLLQRVPGSRPQRIHLPSATGEELP
jgi:hypothetical protein